MSTVIYRSSSNNVWTLEGDTVGSHHNGAVAYYQRNADGIPAYGIDIGDTDALDAFDKVTPIEALIARLKFWHRHHISGLTEIEVSGHCRFGQEFYGRPVGGEWLKRTTTVAELVRWYHERCPPPKVDTLAGIVLGVQAGWYDTTGLVARVDNDSVNVLRLVEGGEPVYLWSGDNPSDVLVALLNGLGVPAER